MKDLFGDRTEDPEFPLFPDAGGNIISEQAMQHLVEELATRSGDPTHFPNGLPRLGRHTWRSMGAIEMAMLGLELFKIQLLARWASPVILHYAQLAPLEGITRQVKHLKDTKSLGELIQELRGDIAAIKTKLPNIDSQTNKLLELEVRVADILDKKEGDDAQHPPTARNVVRYLRTKASSLMAPCAALRRICKLRPVATG